MTRVLTLLVRRLVVPNTLQSSKDVASTYADLLRLRLVDKTLAEFFGNAILTCAPSGRSCGELAQLLASVSIVKMRLYFTHKESLIHLCHEISKNAKSFRPVEIFTLFNAIKRLPRAIPLSMVDDVAKQARDLVCRYSQKEVHLLLEICGKISLEGHSNEMESFIVSLLKRRSDARNFQETVYALRAVLKQKSPCQDFLVKVFQEVKKGLQPNLLTRDVIIILLQILSKSFFDQEKRNEVFNLLLSYVKSHRKELIANCAKEIIVCAAKIDYSGRDSLKDLFVQLSTEHLQNTDQVWSLQILASALQLQHEDEALYRLLIAHLRSFRFDREKIKRAMQTFAKERRESLVDQICDKVYSGDKSIDSCDSPISCARRVCFLGASICSSTPTQGNMGINFSELLEFVTCALRVSSVEDVQIKVGQVARSLDKNIEARGTCVLVPLLNHAQVHKLLRFFVSFRLHSCKLARYVIESYYSMQQHSTQVEIEIFTYIGFFSVDIQEDIWTKVLERLNCAVHQLDSFSATQILASTLACRDRRVINPLFIAKVIQHLLQLESVGSTELAITLHAMTRLFINEPSLFISALEKYISLPSDPVSVSKVFYAVTRYRYFVPNQHCLKKLFHRVLREIPALDYPSLFKVLCSCGSFKRFCTASANEIEDGISLKELHAMAEKAVGYCEKLKRIHATTLATMSLSLASLNVFQKSLRRSFIFALEDSEKSLLCKTTFALAMVRSEDDYGSFMASLARQYAKNINTLLNFDRLAYNAFILYPSLVEKGFLDSSEANAQKILVRINQLNFKIIHVEDLLLALETTLKYPMIIVPKSLVLDIYLELKKRNRCLTTYELEQLQNIAHRLNSSGALSVPNDD